MALIREIHEVAKDRQTVHKQVECGYSTFSSGGTTYLQLDTYGSIERQIPGKTSQSLQLDEQGAAELVDILQRTFPGI